MGLMDGLCALLLGYMLFNGAASQPAAIDWLRRKIVGYVLLCINRIPMGDVRRIIHESSILRYIRHFISVLFDNPPTR